MGHCGLAVALGLFPIKNGAKASSAVLLWFQGASTPSGTLGPLPVASSSLRPLSRSLLGIASEIWRLWLMLAPAFSFPLLTRLVLSIVDEASTGEGLRGKLGTANMSGTLKVAGEGKISGSSSGKLELRML